MSVSKLVNNINLSYVKVFFFSRFKTLKNNSGSQVTAASGSGGISLAFREIEVFSILFVI